MLRRQSLSEKDELLLHWSEKIITTFRHIKLSFQVRDQGRLYACFPIRGN